MATLPPPRRPRPRGPRPCSVASESASAPSTPSCAALSLSRRPFRPAPASPPPRSSTSHPHNSGGTWQAPWCHGLALPGPESGLGARCRPRPLAVCHGGPGAVPGGLPLRGAVGPRRRRGAGSPGPPAPGRRVPGPRPAPAAVRARPAAEGRGRGAGHRAPRLRRQQGPAGVYGGRSSVKLLLLSPS